LAHRAIDAFVAAAGNQPDARYAKVVLLTQSGRQKDGGGRHPDGDLPFVTGDVPIELLVLLPELQPVRYTRYRITTVRTGFSAPGTRILSFL